MSEIEITALFVETGGCYFNLPGVDPWDKPRDARRCTSRKPAVAHPECQRWGRYWHGSTRKPHQYKLGDDDGCFEFTLNYIREHGGIAEHPADSLAWDYFGLNKPPREGGWVKADQYGGHTCYVEQGHYGHFSRKPTWLLAYKTKLPELIWGKSPQRLHPKALEKYGYEKARRIGVMAMVGGKNKQKIRNATPIPFRDLLINLARSVTTEATPRNGE